MSGSVRNHFELFGLPVVFGVDQAQLQEVTRRLLGEWHPDRFSSASDAEKRHAVQMTSLINEAADTLKNPLSRAGHLLVLEGVDSEDFQQSDIAGEFLLQQMHWRDALEEAEQSDDLDAITGMKKRAREGRESLYEEFAQALEGNDLQTAKGLFHRLQFIEKFLLELNQAEERLLDY